MNILKSGLIAATFGALSFGVSAGGIDVDLFNGSQSASDDVDGGGIVWAPEYGPDATVLGSYRDIGVECISGCVATVLESKIVVGAGILAFSTDGGVDGKGYVVWDGTGTPGAGLGGFDLAAAGSAFQLTTNFSDAGGGTASWSFSVYAEDTSGDWSNIDLVATDVAAPTVSYIPFSGFAACGFSDAVVTVTCAAGPSPVDLSDLALLSVTLNTSGTKAIDLILDSVRVVPEPSVLALLGTGFFAVGLAGLRRKKQAA